MGTSLSVCWGIHLERFLGSSGSISARAILVGTTFICWSYYNKVPKVIQLNGLKCIAQAQRFKVQQQDIGRLSPTEVYERESGSLLPSSGLLALPEGQTLMTCLHTLQSPMCVSVSEPRPFLSIKAPQHIIRLDHPNNLHSITSVILSYFNYFNHFQKWMIGTSTHKFCNSA